MLPLRSCSTRLLEPVVIVKGGLEAGGQTRCWKSWNIWLRQWRLEEILDEEQGSVAPAIFQRNCTWSKVDGAIKEKKQLLSLLVQERMSCDWKKLFSQKISRFMFPLVPKKVIFKKRSVCEGTNDFEKRKITQNFYYVWVLNLNLRLTNLLLF